MDGSHDLPSPSNDLNDLFDYDVGLDEILKGDGGTISNIDAPKPPGDLPSLGLGLDEEVKITKKRQPVAKLDEGRLLSQPGIPRLRQTAKKKLRFKGKGHEFADAARLLNFYQLWLDDLFPRAKFADGLTIIEKLGHTKRIQTMRREWIDEERRKVLEPIESSRNDLDTQDPPVGVSLNTDGRSVPASQMSDSELQQMGTDSKDHDLFVPDAEGIMEPPGAARLEPEYDELDDLLKEQDMSERFEATARASELVHDEFDAEYEAMNELGM